MGYYISRPIHQSKRQSFSSYAARVLSMLQATGDPYPLLQPIMEKYLSQDANFGKF